jgi:hypothetical protein
MLIGIFLNVVAPVCPPTDVIAVITFEFVALMLIDKFRRFRSVSLKNIWPQDIFPTLDSIKIDSLTK